MIVGDKAVFALESNITQAYAYAGLTALGCFVIHIEGIRYGMQATDATMLANSFDEVGKRLSNRGHYIAPWATDREGGEIADAVSHALYADGQLDRKYFGIAQTDFSQEIYSARLLWAPDGDAAFDDGSYVLQFDVHDRVGLIGFKKTAAHTHSPGSLSDINLAEDMFYDLLEQWYKSFEAEWSALPKVQ